jgi:predicted glycosyltransferase involved in capsule biosynthesis
MATGANLDLVPEDICTYKYESAVDHVICIPACDESGLIEVLENLKSLIPVKNIAVCIAINAAENASSEIKKKNNQSFIQIKEYLEKENYPYPMWVGLYNHLPPKKAGVGLARKLAMDKACEWLKNPTKNNLLLCLDADCLVAKNWAKSIVDYFNLYIQINAASVYFEHQFTGNKMLDAGIEQYELHLRYLKNALQWAKYPWFYHTVGSSMALRASMYIKSGGMNTRQAGEDFYFLHKLMPLGFGQISNTAVYPAARYSSRVPFGTGRSLLEYRETGIQNTYNFEIFRELRALFGSAFESDLAWENSISSTLKNILLAEGIEAARKEAIAHSAGREMAIVRFEKWFSGFRLIKIMHALRSSGYPDLPVEKEAEKLLFELNLNPQPSVLNTFRKIDKGN